MLARIRLPPLHERHEDIPALLDHYLMQLNARFHPGFCRRADPVVGMTLYGKLAKYEVRLWES